MKEQDNEKPPLASFILKPHKLRLHLLINHPKTCYRIKWAFIHAAMITFLLDFIAAIWRPFGNHWDNVQRFTVALATVLVTLAEYFHEEPAEYNARVNGGGDVHEG